MSIFLIVSGQIQAAVINAKGVSLEDVSSAIASAKDGDTVVIPAGTANWTSTLTVSKSITLQGATTTDTSSSLGSANDQTVIVDEIKRGSGGGAPIVRITLTPGRFFRMTGITFRYSPSNTKRADFGAIRFDGISTSASFRVDHCHIDGLYNIFFGFTGSLYGVVDHCLLDATRFVSSFIIRHDTWGGRQFGDGSWADSPYFGADKFVYIENNVFNNPVIQAQTNGGIDCVGGGRYVVRYNTFNNCLPLTHGTDSTGRARSCRAMEVYNNSFNFTFDAQCGVIRGGTELFFNNHFQGAIHHGPPLTVYREFITFKFGGADGTCAWDSNDSHGAYLIGKHTGPNNSQTLVVSAAGWATNQWVGYIVKNTTNPAQHSFVRSNTSDTITYAYDTSFNPHGNLIFNTGDSFEIHKVIAALDQPGRGKGDLISGEFPNMINAATKSVSWPHQSLEPCYSWNNRHSDGTFFGFSSPYPSILPNRDYYNENTAFDGKSGVGVGTLADRPKTCTQGVAYWATDQGDWDSTHDGPDGQLYQCTAPNTWTLYYKPYTYPHPMTTSQPPPQPIPSATPSSIQHVWKKSKKQKAKKAKNPRELLRNFEFGGFGVSSRSGLSTAASLFGSKRC